MIKFSDFVPASDLKILSKDPRAKHSVEVVFKHADLIAIENLTAQEVVTNAKKTTKQKSTSLQLVNSFALIGQAALMNRKVKVKVRDKNGDGIDFDITGLAKATGTTQTVISLANLFYGVIYAELSEPRGNMRLTVSVSARLQLKT